MRTESAFGESEPGRPQHYRRHDCIDPALCKKKATGASLAQSGHDGVHAARYQRGMSKKTPSPDPEIYCDFNGRMTERGFLPARGTFRDLASLGLTIEDAVGRTFVFVMDDADEHGNPDDIMCNGSIVRDDEFGILLERDVEGFYWRSELQNE